jgi:demethylmenaquinone methyltransferase/2-methoxy-6-polyprenyl-1,4-benzoquinol methylase
MKKLNEKETNIENMFSSIAHKYDLLNSILSLNFHNSWRRNLVSKCNIKHGGSAVDVCCGTGDVCFELSKYTGKTGHIVGIDISEPMLQIAREKAISKELNHIEFINDKADDIPFEDNMFDCATVAFGLRSVPDVPAVIRDMARVVKPGGIVASLEIGRVNNPLIRIFWKLYFITLTPLIARIFGGKKEAYEFLPNSVLNFISSDELSDIFKNTGLINTRCKKLMFGTVYIHSGIKPLNVQTG